MNQPGLTADEVLQSREKHGANTLTKRKRKSWFRSFLGNFGDPMIRILLIALGINCVFLFKQANWLETFGIAGAILIAVIVSTISEYGSEQAFEKLQASAQNIEVRVRRDGKTTLISIEEVVVGDIVLLGSGEKIPADGVIIGGTVEVDQSVLNGESKEARKAAGGAQQKHDFLNPNLLFRGTVVTNGDAAMRVTAVGDATEYGKIAAELQESTPKSPLKLKLEKLAKMISLIGYIGAGLVAFSYLFNVLIIANSFNGTEIVADLRNFNFMFSKILNAATLMVSVIVMAVPEGLPMMITVVLSSNMKNMLRDNVLVRQLNGVETAGSMNILFTDKTGTLTHGKLEVVGFVAGDGKFQEIKTKDSKLIGLSADNEIARILGTSLRFNTAAEMSKGKPVGGNSTDRILLEFAQNLPAYKNINKINTTPFDSANKFMATIVNAPDAPFGSSKEGVSVLLKGAQEVILPKCTQFYNQNGETEKLAKNSAVLKTIDSLTSQAYRLIAVAVSETKAHENLVLVGLIAIRDQVRAEAVTSVARLNSAGIQTVMITGDAKATAIAVSHDVGILSSDSKQIVLTSDEMSLLSDEQLKKMLPDIRVVARALPSDKSRLVRIAQSLNLVSGMTGDGVNDAPALKKADIGFAMGSGTEVAKEAGDIVILDDNINSITRAVSYGRTIFKSIRKFLIFKLTINLCAMAVSIIAPLLSIDTPITVIQMLWINIVMDTLAGLAFGGEKPREQYMTEPPKRRDEPIINRMMWNQILVTGIFTAVISLWFLKSKFLDGLFTNRGDAYAMTAFFAFFMFINIFNSFNARTHSLNPVSHIRTNKPFIWIMGAVTAAQILIIYVGGSIFRTQALAVQHLLLVMVLAATVIPVDLLRKLITNRKGVQTT